MVDDQKSEPARALESAGRALDAAGSLAAGVVDVQRHVLELLRCRADRIEVALFNTDRTHFGPRSRRVFEEPVELRLHALDLFSRGLVKRRVVAGVPYVLGKMDERTAQVQIVDGAAVVPALTTVTAESASRARYCPPPASFSASSFSK